MTATIFRGGRAIYRHDDAVRKNVFHVEVDPRRNLLSIRFNGVVTAEHMRLGAQDVGRLLPQMPRGFVALMDLTALELMELDCVPHLTRIMDLFLAAGIGCAVRVIPDPDKDIGFTLLSLTHYRGKIPIKTCATLAEAETHLKAVELRES